MLVVSVLSIWGQETTTFNIKEATQVINTLKNSQKEIVNQTKNSHISDSENTEKVLSSTFANLDSLMTAYNHVADHPDLRGETEILISKFVKDFSSAILDDDKKSIKISSNKFLDVAETYSQEFRKQYDKIQNTIKPNNEGIVVPADGEAVNTEGVDSETEPLNWDKILVWVAVILSFISLGTALIAFLKISSYYKSLDRRNQDIEANVRQLELKVNELKTPAFVESPRNGYRPVYPNYQSNQPYQPSKPERDNKPVLPPKKEEVYHKKEEKTGPKVVSSETNLYALANAGSSFAEFYKVSQDKTRDKVFMLTLAKPNDETATFTIVPDMPADLMNSVIQDRETYLPAIFCEKSITSSNPTKIEVEFPGKAKNVNGKWQVQERMSIRLT